MDIPSLFMIPSAVSSGKVHSVFPNSTDADFDFNRDSDATRVNSEGLIERVGYYSAELITNGNFNTDTSSWFGDSNASLTWQTNKSVLVASTDDATFGIAQSNVLTSGKTYRVSFRFKPNNATTFRVRLGASGSGQFSTTSFTLNEWNDVDFVGVANGTTFEIGTLGGSISNFYLDDVSCKEVTGDRARLNYEIEGGLVNTKPSLLLEPQSTNLVTYSEDFSHSSYIKVNSTTIVSNEIKAPDNTTTADLIKAAQTGSIQGVYNNISFTSGQSYAFSVFAKKKENIYLQVQAGGGTFGTCFANFDLENGVVGTVSGGTGQIEAFTNDWYRCIFIVSAISTGTGNISLDLISSSTAGRNDNFTGNVGDGLYIWGAMVEQQSYATSYIPTNGSTQTRAAETCNGAGTSSILPSEEGILYAEIAALASQVNYRYVALTDGTTNNRVDILYRGDVANKITSRLTVGGAEQARFDIIIDNELNFNKFALSWKQNRVKFFINGTQQGSTDTSANVPSANTFNELMFDRGDGNEQFYGKVRDIRVYNTKEMTDSEVDILLTKITS